MRSAEAITDGGQMISIGRYAKGEALIGNIVTPTVSSGENDEVIVLID